jgi:membrane-associated protein
MPQLLNPVFLIETAGYAGVLFIIFAETGLFFGFFFPGDSLLFAAGVLTAGGALSLPALLVGVPAAAALGNAVGYWFGAWAGPRLFTKEDSFFFNKRYLARSHEFYQTYGPRAILLARFVPVVRTFVPIVAGVGSMRYAMFTLYNVLGSVLWGAGVVLAGYYLGHAFPAVGQYLLPLSLLVIVVSFLPIAREYLARRSSQKE